MSCASNCWTWSRSGRARVKEFYWADVIETNDRRPQLAIAAVFGALACGFGLAFLRDRMDKTLQTPEDVTRQLDLPVLGTTTSSRAIKPALLAEQIAGDYQTIRTNLGLVYDGGLPRRLVVSSAGTREGKTTFAVNLATSLAKSGKKVLLIDGDLRKPDVGQMLNVPPETGYLQDVLLGGDASHLAYVSPTSGLHILAANPRHLADPYELLTSSMAAEQIERLSREYDHVVIDSPPALAFPDALVWAKLADAVVLVSFAGSNDGARSQGGQGTVRARPGPRAGGRSQQRPARAGPVPLRLHLSGAGGRPGVKHGSCCWRPGIRNRRTMAATRKHGVASRSDGAIPVAPGYEPMRQLIVVRESKEGTARGGPGLWPYALSTAPLRDVVLDGLRHLWCCHAAARRAERIGWTTPDKSVWAVPAGWQTAGGAGAHREESRWGARPIVARGGTCCPALRCSTTMSCVSTRRPGTVRAPLPGS